MAVILGGNSGAGGISSVEYYDGKPIFAGQVRYVPKYWDDLRIAPNAFQGAGVNDPSFALFRDNGVASVGVFTWQFSATLNQDLFFWFQLPHSWKEGTSIHPQVHWAPMTAGAGDVAWTIEFTIAKAGDVYPTTSQDNIFAAASGVAFEHQVSPFLPISMTGDLISTVVGSRLRRRGANAGDTYAGLAALVQFSLHFELDTPGSRQMSTK